MPAPRATSSALGREPARAGNDLPGERFERSARRWIRAYPRRWRETRGEELLGVLQDLAGPDAGRLGARGAFDLVRGGWATRRCEHPPLGRWLTYRLFDRELPEHRAWVRDDVEGALYGLRTSLPAQIPFGIFLLWSEDGPRRWLWLGLVLTVVFLVPRWTRDRTLERHLGAGYDQRVYGGLLTVGTRPRPRVGARSGLAWFVACWAVIAVASLTALATAPVGTWGRPVPTGFETGTGPVTNRWPAMVTVLLAAAVGLVLAVLVRRRVRGFDRGVDQPHRVVRPVSPSGALTLMAFTLLGVALAGLEVAGQLVMGPSVLLAGVAVIMIPAGVAALVAVRHPAVDAPGAVGRPEPVAAIDVWRAVVGSDRHRDEPLPVLAPAPASASDVGRAGSAGWRRGGLADA